MEHLFLASPTPRKRRRPALACVQCRTRKVRCDRNSPCSQCVKTKSSDCAYEALPHTIRADAVTPRRLVGDIPASSSGVTTSVHAPVRPQTTSPAVAYTPGSSVSVEALSHRVKYLESQLDAQSERSELGSYRNEPLSVSGPGPPQTPFPVRGIQHKTRFFGQSHWMNGSELFPMLLRLFAQVESDKSSPLVRAVDSCKALARIIKAQRIPPFVASQIGQHLPQRQIADALIVCYLRTFETVYRVVHIPTFRTEYERYWENPSAAKPAFIALSQLCMAIGACFLDETYSLRSPATKWIYEAQAWLTSPPEKTKMTSTGLQVMCLLRFARQVAGLGADLTWISAGSLIRTAMYMGLHRDPQRLSVPKRTLYSSELRRRLWATILEIVLQSSVDAGGPPLLAMSDFDTRPPGNFDDAELVDTSDVEFTPRRGPTEYTQSSVQIAMLRSFSTRLAIAKSVNDLRSNTEYDETLRLNGELATTCQSLVKQMAAWPKDEVGVSGLSSFQRRIAEWALYRFFFALHVPRLRQSLIDPVFYFSRKMCIDTALKLCQIANLLPTQPYSTAGDFDSLLSSGSGPYRAIVFQAVTIIGLELLTKKQEAREGSSPSVTLGGSEMRSILEEALDWTTRQIRSGETNCKGHAAIQTLLTQIDGIEAGLDGQQLDDSCQRKATESLERCYDIMSAAAGFDLGATESQPLDIDGGFEAFDDDPMDFLTGWEEVPSWVTFNTNPNLCRDSDGNMDLFAGSFGELDNGSD